MDLLSGQPVAPVRWRIEVFWDILNCCPNERTPTARNDVRRIISELRRLLWLRFGGSSRNGDWSRAPLSGLICKKGNLTAKQLQDLYDEGFKFRGVVPKSGADDHGLRNEMSSLTNDFNTGARSPAHHIVVLISSDNDFAGELRDLGQVPGLRVALVHAAHATSALTETVDWAYRIPLQELFRNAVPAPMEGVSGAAGLPPGGSAGRGRAAGAARAAPDFQLQFGQPSLLSGRRGRPGDAPAGVASAGQAPGCSSHAAPPPPRPALDGSRGPSAAAPATGRVAGGCSLPPGNTRFQPYPQPDPRGRPPPQPAAAGAAPPQQGGGDGTVIVTLTRHHGVGYGMGFDESEGGDPMLVTEVLPGGPAAGRGVRPGFRLAWACTAKGKRLRLADAGDLDCFRQHQSLEFCFVVHPQPATSAAGARGGGPPQPPLARCPPPTAVRPPGWRAESVLGKDPPGPSVPPAMAPPSRASGGMDLDG